MRTIQEKLDSLNSKSVWHFTKHETDFDANFKATRLFVDALSSGENIEEYFSSHAADFGITNRHRVLIIAQMFGLITKTPFFSRGNSYRNERPTAVFDMLNKYEIGSYEYNTLKSEQLLKVRMKPIIDSTIDGYDKVILPLLFSYKVLKKLQTDYSINSVPLDVFYTYVMTCNRFDEVEESAFLISKKPSVSTFVSNFKDSSRIIPLFEKNNKLLLFNGNTVSINTLFDNYFYENLVSKINLSDLNLILDDINAYAYFLYNCQNFNINLIDNPAADEQNIEINLEPIKQIIEISDNEEKYDSGYVELVDEVKETNINPQIAENAYKNKLQFSESKRGTKVVKNPIFGKIAIQQSGYQCNANPAHITFESKKTGENFMEAHHLAPMSYAKEIFEKFKVNADCIENIVSLCPNCHRAAHYGSNKVKKELITHLFNNKLFEFQKIGLDLSLEDLLKMYL
jgi:5-methylcytosine-specific restriction protein A